jgi:hypothetical protein
MYVRSMTATAVVQSEQAMLDAACRSQRAARQAEVDLAVAALDWAVAHPPLDRADRCCVRVPRPGGPDGIEPLNGEGVPVVSAVAVAELAVALGMSTESGRRLVSDVLELAYRLPAVWERLLDGRLLVWQARRIADLTHPLARLAARFVDRHLGAVVGRIGMGPPSRTQPGGSPRSAPPIWWARAARGPSETSRASTWSCGTGRCRRGSSSSTRTTGP